eukprot:gene24412-30756_t
MKIGLKHEQVLKSFYPNALKRYNECTNLKMVCEEEGITSADGLLSGLQVGTKFSPMLAKGFSTSGGGQVAAVEAAMKHEPFVMDIKLDGERMQCHLDEGGHVSFFTRRGNDYTDNYMPLSQIVRDNILVDVPHAQRDQYKMIIDGEVCAWDVVLQENMPFGSNLSVAKVERELRESYGNYVPAGWDRNLSACMYFVAFDLVYFDGPEAGQIIDDAMNECGIDERFVDTGEISHLPLAVRRKILTKILHPVANRFDMVKSRSVLSADVTERRAAIEAFFNEVTVAGEEGLVIKNLSSTYELGEKSRGTGSWVKMKPEYGDQTEDLDLLILGAYYGEGTGMRGEGLSTFLCGVRDDSNNGGGWKTLCKVGTGYSFDELRELRDRLKDITVPWNNARPPEHLAHWNINKRDDRPNVYILPENSIVVQLKCAELVDSFAFSAGVTCRFPRLQRIRYDKSPQEVMKLSEVMAIKDQVRDTTHQTFEKTQGQSKKGKKAKGEAAEQVAVGKKRTNVVDDQFRVSNRKISREGRIFEGQIFCVLENEFTYGRTIDLANVASGGAINSTNTVDTNSANNGNKSNNTTQNTTQMSDLTQSQSQFRLETQTQVTQKISPNTTQNTTQTPAVTTQQLHNLFPTQTPSIHHGDTQAYELPELEKEQETQVSDHSGGSASTHSTSTSSAGRRYTREELISSIKAQGGEVVASPTHPDCKIIAGNKRTFQLNNYIERGDRDVIDFSYIIECLAADELLTPRSVQYLGCCAATRLSLVGVCNIFGDSYTEDITPEDLQRLYLSLEGVVGKAEKEVHFLEHSGKMTAAARKKAATLIASTEVLTAEDLREARHVLSDWAEMKTKGWRDLCCEYLQEEEREPVYFSKLNAMWSDRTVICLDMYSDLGACQTPTMTAILAAQSKRTSLNSALIEASNTPRHAALYMALYHRLIAYGAVVSDSLHGAVTHVVVMPDARGRGADIKDRIRLLRTLDARSYEKRIVSPKWVEGCLERGYMDEPTREEKVAI